MKPRNDRQRRVVELSATLPPITQQQRRWAYDHCFSGIAFLCKHKAWCSMCGETFDAMISPLSTILIGEKVVCPHCGKKLTVKHSRKQKHEEKWYYTILTTRKGFQVCRNFSVSKFIRRGEKPYYSIDEVVQNWITEDGREEIVARPIKATATYYDNWDTGKPLELRDGKRQSIYLPDKYRIASACVYPYRKLLPLATRNGYTGRNQSGIPESEHVRLLITDREAEILEKNGQFALLKWKYNRNCPEFRMPYAHAIRIANRNKYKVKDASMWFDYLDLLDYFHLDTHNAHYVCPRNLRAEHDRLHRRRERIEARKEAERKSQELIKNEARYRTEKGAYFGICFGDEDLMVTVIQSVADMIEEGKAMHHCVGRYHNKKNSLILSARDHEGRRIETVEVNLETFKVVQSRAACNGTSTHHSQIITLVERNMHLIRKAAATA